VVSFDSLSWLFLTSFLFDCFPFPALFAFLSFYLSPTWFYSAVFSSTFVTPSHTIQYVGPCRQRPGSSSVFFMMKAWDMVVHWCSVGRAHSHLIRKKVEPHFTQIRSWQRLAARYKAVITWVGGPILPIMSPGSTYFPLLSVIKVVS
jgi:hypothetical protein